MKTVLESVVLRGQSLGGFLMLAPFVGAAVMKGVAYPVQDIVVEHQSAKKRSELLFESLFPDIRLAAYGRKTKYPSLSRYSLTQI